MNLTAEQQEDFDATFADLVARGINPDMARISAMNKLDGITMGGNTGRRPNGRVLDELGQDDHRGGDERIDDSTSWPSALDPAALHGIAGEIVRVIAPNTEADSAAILLQFLVCFGALVGRGPHYKVEGDEHHPNIYTLLVGATSKARKGTSWGRIRGIFERMPDWKPHVSGLSSGEGLKYNVRDEREGTKQTKAGEHVVEVIDEGVTDKRLLVVESEFASALRAAQRQGNTLSATIREGWDTGNLRTLTKSDPIIATGAHISIIGHITDDELRAELTGTDTANGFANRFLFVAVRRSKCLPFGGDEADDGELEAFAIRLRELAEKARTRHRIGMTTSARTFWTTIYEELSEGHGGLHGAVTARGEAQCIRLALIYCLLDGAAEIDAPHLIAAVAVWQYADATAKHIFGASLGDRTADEIMRRLQRAAGDGLTRTEISDTFKRHKTAEQIGAALDLLRRKGRATCEAVGTGGRPVELWRAAK
ncbi:MAG: YfjI family protein [Casimicrobiaceae bacterium]